MNVLETGDPSGISDAAVEAAVEIIASGGIAAIPTETFYGLAADAENESAVRKVFLLKERLPGLPVLILVGSVESASRYARDIPPSARKLMETFWPGGLTLVFHAAPGVSSVLTAETGKIGIRLSSHAAATRIARALGRAVTGTSANVSGRPPCANAEDVIRTFGEGLDLVLDGGQAAGKIPSTVLDVTSEPPRILRRGAVPEDRIRNVLSR